MPPGRPEKPLTATGDRIADNVGVATAWLLRGQRHAAGHAGVTAFATALGAHADPAADADPADPADAVGKWTVSRVENARTAPGHGLVAGYERLGGLPAGTLAGPIDVLNRYFAPAVVAAPALARRSGRLEPGRYEQLAAIVDRVYADAVVTGAEWDELTAFLAHRPHFWPLRADVWDRLAQRLLHEMIMADGLCWVQRFEALGRLLSHPLGERAAIAACASLGADPANQVFVETVCAVDNSTHPAAREVILHQLLDPTTDGAFEGALFACVRMSRYGLFDDAQAATVAVALQDRLAGGGLRHDLALTASSVLARLDRFDRPADRAANDERLRELAPRQRVGRYAAGEVVRRLTGAVDAALPGFRVATDGVFGLLLNELLFDPTYDVRLYTAMLVKAGPYGAPLADALVAELARPSSPAGAPLVLLLVDALRVLGGRDQAAALQALVVDPTVDDEVRRFAAHWVGHLCTERPDDPFWRDALEEHRRAWVTYHDETTVAVLHGLTYGLGIAGGEPQLRWIEDQPDLPQETRSAARWWLDTPDVVRRSARL